MTNASTLNDLPVELLEIILEYFVHVTEPSCFSVQLVSKGWHRTLISLLSRIHSLIIYAPKLTACELFILKNARVKRLALMECGNVFPDNKQSFPTVEELVVNLYYYFGGSHTFFSTRLDTFPNLRLCRVLGNSLRISSLILPGVRIESYWSDTPDRAGWIERTHISHSAEFRGEMLENDIATMLQDMPDLPILYWACSKLVCYITIADDRVSKQALSLLAKSIKSDEQFVRRAAIFCLQLKIFTLASYFLSHIAPEILSLLFHEMINSVDASEATLIPLFDHMLDLGAIPNKQDSFGDIPLHYAVKRNCIRLFNYLIEKSSPSDLLVENTNGQIPAEMIICSSSQFYSISQFLDHYPEEICRRLIHFAVSDRYLRSISNIGRMLAESPDCVNSIDKLGRSPLHMIRDLSNPYKKDHTAVPILQLLLSIEQVDVNIADSNGYTPLMVYIQSGKLTLFNHLYQDERVNLLLEDKQGRSIAHHVAKSPLIAQRRVNAVDQEAKISIFEYLRKKGVDINKPDHNGVTPYEILLKEGNHQVANMFIKHMVDPKANLSNGMNPLLFCIAEGNAEEVGRTVLTCQMLIEAGVDVSATDKNGNNALHLACSQVWGGDIAVLINGGVDQNQRNRKNQLPVFISLSQGDYTTSNLLLLSKGLDLRLISPEEWSFITTVAASSDLFLTEVLLLMDGETVPSAMNRFAPKAYPIWFNGEILGTPLFKYCFQKTYVASLKTLFRMKLFKNYLEKAVPDQFDFPSRLSIYLGQHLSDTRYLGNDNVFSSCPSRFQEMIKDITELTQGNIVRIGQREIQSTEKRKRKSQISTDPNKKRRLN